MLKTIIGAMLGIGIISALYLGPFSPTPTPVKGQSANEQPVTVNEDQLAAGADTALNSLIQVGDNISDPATKLYYQKLIDSYDLNSITDNTSGDGVQISENIAQNVEHIAKVALTLPLQEAGKTITDPEIADFYQDFLKKSGFNISTK